VLKTLSFMLVFLLEFIFHALNPIKNQLRTEWLYIADQIVLCVRRQRHTCDDEGFLLAISTYPATNNRLPKI